MTICLISLGGWDGVKKVGAEGEIKDRPGPREKRTESR